MILIILVFYFVNRDVNKYLKIIPYYLKKNLVLFLILFFGFILWFLKFPTYRYGSSYIIGSIIFSQFYIFKDFILEKKFQKYLKIFVIFIILIISLKYISKYEKQKNFWPNIYSFSDTSQVPLKFKKIYKKDSFLYFNAEDKLCMYSPSPCTNIPVHSNLNLKDIYGYKIYYLEIK